MHRINLSIPVYNFKCTVIIENDITSIVDKYMKKSKMGDVPKGEEYHGYAMMTADMRFYIFYDLQSLTPGIIAHEISHTVDYLLQGRELELTGETRSYITEHMINKVFDYCLKHNILISKHLNYSQKTTPAPVAESGPRQLPAKQ